ncbi:Nitrilase [uncultured archaeon]|nr:Nitrilase [uncultured archaeon]
MPMGSKLRLALVQLAPQPADRAGNLRLAEALIGSKKADIFVFPHLFSTAAGPEEAARLAEGPDGPTPAFMKALAQKKKAYVLGSYLAENKKGKIKKTKKSETSNSKPFIRFLAFDPNGNVIGVYDAIHLCSIRGEPDHFSAGGKLPFFDLLTFRSGIIDSYDLRFPELAREFALSNGFILFVAGAFKRSERAAWDALLAARAVENQMFCIGCNFASTPEERVGAPADAAAPRPDSSSNCYCGGSAVFAPDGRKLHQAGEGDQVLILDIDPFEVEWNRMSLQYITDAKAAPKRARKRVHESPLDKE